jgi:hypothetical protein
MTSLLGGHLLRADLAHADESLSPTAAFDLHHTSISMKIRDAEGLSFLLDAVLDPEVEPTVVSMYLKPRNYRPEELSPPEFPPSNLFFGVDQKHDVAAVALLAFDKDHRSHQWLPRGSAWHDGVAPLAMDPNIPYDTPFPRDAYIAVAQLREVLSQWAWGTELPPPSIEWRPATDREVRWHWM